MPTKDESRPNTIKEITPRKWVIIFILFYANLLHYMDRYTLSSLLKEVRNYFNIKDDESGLLQTALILSSMFFAPIFGYFGDRYNRKLIMAIVIFCWSIILLVGSFMTNFWIFLLFRALAGIGDSSYVTLAPAVIGDFFTGTARALALAIFYIATPVGSGCGYIVGSGAAKYTGAWQWGLRVTPCLGIIAALLILFVLKEPEKSEHPKPPPWCQELKNLVLNKSFMFLTAGFTCVSFVAGAFSWWGPYLLQQGLQLQANGNGSDIDNAAFIFGLMTFLAGILGVSLGYGLSRLLRTKFSRADPIICGVGLVISGPFLIGAVYSISYQTALMYVLLFFGEITLLLNWAIVADVLLSVVSSSQRATAEGFHTFSIHALGDAGSPYLFGILSMAFKENLHINNDMERNFIALKYAFCAVIGVEFLGAIFFYTCAFYIVEDKAEAAKYDEEVVE